MGWQRRSKKTYPITWRWWCAFLGGSHLEIYEGNIECLVSHAWKKNYAQGFETCKYFYKSRLHIKNWRFRFRQKFQQLNFGSLLQSRHSIVYVSRVNPRLRVQLKCRRMVSRMYHLWIMRTQFSFPE